MTNIGQVKIDGGSTNKAILARYITYSPIPIYVAPFD